jgi:hypothetical protein
MASFNVTTHAAFIPEVWSKEAQIARESQLRMANLVDRFDADVMAYGDTIHVPTISNGFTATAIGADGSLADTSFSETTVDITVDQWLGTRFSIPDRLGAQSYMDLAPRYIEKEGYALGRAVELQLLGLYSSTLRTALQILDDNRVPMGDRHFVVKPASLNEFRGIDKFVRYDAISYPANQSPILTGMFGNLYGADVTITPEILTVLTETQNLLFHRSAFGLAMQREISFVEFAKTKFAKDYGSSELFGKKVMRDDHAVQLKS